MSDTNKLQQTMDEAQTYEQWLTAASKADKLNGSYDWQKKPASKHYPYKVLQEHYQTISELLEKKDYLKLIPYIQESLYRTTAELSKPKLYQPAYTGTKTLIRNYLMLINKALKTLCESEIDSISTKDKLAQFKQAEHNFGRPALMLSGGGTFGIYHIGVVATLIKHQLLPSIISGSSMGAITAGMLATHTDKEVLTLLNKPEESNYSPLKRLPLKGILQQQSLLDPEQLRRCVEHNVGLMTFEEAFKKTGRNVSITISPARTGQKPRILNYQTAPSVFVASAAQASCSVPGLFPPCQLYEKNALGEKQAYLKGERWYDGSFATDIPRQRMSRLHNANYFIVSQANPHIVPFVSQRQDDGLAAFLADLLVSSSFSQGKALLKLGKRRFHSQAWSSWLNHASLMLDQDYLGDINIHPEFPPSRYTKFMKNPSPSERDYILKMGERCTWPKLAMIRDQTQVSRTLQACIAHLEQSAKEESLKATAL